MIELSYITLGHVIRSNLTFMCRDQYDILVFSIFFKMNSIASVPSESNQESNPVIISVQTGLDGYRLRNFYITVGLQGFVWMIFHFSVIFFFTFLLQNIFLVGFFL